MWHSVSSLLSNRSFTALAVISNPNGITFYLHVGGGSDGVSKLSTIEIAQVDVTTPTVPFDTEDQTISSWTLSNSTLDAGRSGLSVTTANTFFYPAIKPNDTWVYWGGDATDENLDAGNVSVTQDYSAFFTVNNPFQTSFPSGYCLGTAGTQLFAVGLNGISSTPCTSAGGRCINVPPDLSKGFNAGFGLSNPRQWLGCSSDGIYYFFVGGVSAAGTLVESVETTYCCS